MVAEKNIKVSRAQELLQEKKEKVKVGQGKEQSNKQEKFGKK